MQKIGVSLVLQSTGAEIMSWDGLPREIEYKGEVRTGAIVGAQVGGDAVLVDRFLEGNLPFGSPGVAAETASYSNGRVVVTRKYLEPDYEQIRASLIASVKAQAGEKILAYCPQYKQANLTAYAVDLALTYPGIAGDKLPEPHRTAWMQGKSIWEHIKALRAHSNAMEDELTRLPTAALETWVSHDWPTP